LGPANSPDRLRPGRDAKKNYGTRSSRPVLFGMAGGRRRAAGPGVGVTDDYGYNVAENPVHITI